MIQPLRVKPRQASQSVLAFMIFFLGLAGLITLGILWLKRASIFFDNTIINFLAHLPIAFIPGLIAVHMAAPPIRYEIPRGEILIEYGSYLRSLKTEWWMSILLWPAAIIALLGSILETYLMFKGSAPGWSTGPGEAVLTGLLVFGLVFFYGNLLNYGGPATIFEKGIRMGPAHYVEWDDIHHLEEKGGAYFIYLNSCPEIPFGALHPQNREAENELLSLLQKKKIMGADHTPPQVMMMKAFSVLAFLLISGSGAALWLKGGMDLRWSVFLAFLAGLGVTLLQERIRGVHKAPRSNPTLEPPGPDQIQAGMRALCIKWLIERAELEAALREPAATGNQEVHRRISLINDAVKSEGCDAHLSEKEKSLFNSPAGTWGVSDIEDARARKEGLAVILWALSLVDEIPPYDEEWDPEMLGEKLEAGMPAPEFLLIINLRPEHEIADARDSAELWHWRARTSLIMNAGAQAPEGLNFAEIISAAAAGAHESGDIPQPIGNDFPFFGKAYRDLDEQELERAALIAYERHFALNWLCGYSQDWDLTPTDT